MQQPRSIMNTALWTVQVLWGIFFSLSGFGKSHVTSRLFGTKGSRNCLGFPRCRRTCSSSSGSVSFFEASA
jgi:hypothetical protein